MPQGPILVFNDSFGALTCALAPRPVWHVSDSWLSRQATRQNLRLNALDDGEVHFLSSLDALPAAPAPVPQAATTVWPLDETPYQIHNHANVFSLASLDIGARFFMQHLPENIEGEIVDLGCGNGVIGLMVLESNPQAEVHFLDESYMAVASSQLNVEVNRPQDLARCQFRVNNVLSGYPSDRLHTVLCNPPFHQHHAVTDHLAWQMFHDAKRCLQYGGELRIVGNRHLDYHHKLKKLFGNCTLVASNQKFVVLRAVKIR
nr:metal-dependent hydrolase [Candidatus Pantoea persica]